MATKSKPDFMAQMGGPVLTLESSPTGYRVTFAGGVRWEKLADYPDWDSAVAAFHETTRLTKGAR